MRRLCASKRKDNTMSRYRDEDYDDYEDDDRPQPRRNKKRRRRSHWYIWVLVIILLLAAAWFFLGSQPRGDSADAGARKAGCSTILIAGTDKDGYRTDTIMLLSVDSANHSAALLSIPRDTYVANTDYSVPKINSACGYAGGGKDGMDELMKQVKNTLGFMPDGYALVDLDAFVKIVDLMGGVEFDVPMDMQYSDPSQNLYIDLKAGKQHLDGEKAIELVRFRSGYAMADLTRTEVQRDFVKAAMKQWATPLNIVKIPALMSIAQSKVTTDLSSGNMLWLARTLLGCKLSDMSMDTLPGQAAYIHGGSYYLADANAVAALMESEYSPYRH